MKVGGRGGVPSLISHPVPSVESTMPQQLTAWGSARKIGEMNSPTKVSLSWHPIGFAIDGEEGRTSFPWLANRGNGRCHVWRRAGIGGELRMGVPSTEENDRSLKTTLIDKNRRGASGGSFKNSELWKKMGNGGRVLREQLSLSSLPPIPTRIGPWDLWKGGVGGSFNWQTASR